MTGTRLFLRTRFTKTAMVCGLLAVVVIRLFIQWVPEVGISTSRPSRFIPLLEAVPAMYAILCVVCVRPRFAYWESLGGARYRLHVAAASLFVVLAPIGVAIVSAGALPTRDRWAWMAVNTATIAGVGVIASRFLGPLWGAIVALTFYAACVIIQNMAGPIVPWLPLASGYDYQPRWLVAAALGILGVLASYRVTSVPLPERHQA